MSWQCIHIQIHPNAIVACVVGKFEYPVDHDKSISYPLTLFVDPMIFSTSKMSNRKSSDERTNHDHRVGSHQIFSRKKSQINNLLLMGMNQTRQKLSPTLMRYSYYSPNGEQSCFCFNGWKCPTTSVVYQTGVPHFWQNHLGQLLLHWSSTKIRFFLHKDTEFSKQRLLERSSVHFIWHSSHLLSRKHILLLTEVMVNAW